MRKPLVLLFLGLFLVGFLTFIPVPVSATSWLTGWTYRQSHIISHAANTGTNYQMKLLVHSGTGTSSGSDVYLNGHCTSFPNDVDFTDDTGNTELSFWIENTAADPIVVWLKVAGDLTTVDKTVYIYYGKSGQSSLSNGDNTFLFFDDFLGTSLNTSKWNQGPITCNVASSILTFSLSAGWDGMYGTTSVGPYNIRSKTRANFTVNYVMEGMSQAGLYGTAIYFYSSSGTTYSWLGNGGALSQLSMSFSLTFHLNEILWTSGHAVFLQDDSQLADRTVNVPTVAIAAGLSTYSGSGSWDWTFLSKYIDPEPQHSTWGAEATQSVAYYIYSSISLTFSLSSGKLEVVNKPGQITETFSIEQVKAVLFSRESLITETFQFSGSTQLGRIILIFSHLSMILGFRSNGETPFLTPYGFVPFPRIPVTAPTEHDTLIFVAMGIGIVALCGIGVGVEKKKRRST